jgi:hypothetical protein
MNVAGLIKRVRRSAFIEDGSVDWTDVNILEELNDVQSALFERAVVKADSGHWLRHAYYTLTPGQSVYRLPPRAASGAIGLVQISATAPLDWFELPEVDEATAERYELATTDAPQRCAVRGEMLHVLPAPSVSGYVLRVQYALRPSRLILPHVSSVAGIVSAVDPVTRVVTLQGLFQSCNEAGTFTVIAGTNAVDIIKPDGWHSVVWSGRAAATNGTAPTLQLDPTGIAAASDMSMIEPGDIMRFADQSDYPALPAEFHRAFADATAAKILTVRGMADRAEELMSHVAPDLKRFESLLAPRVGSNTFILSAPEFC